MGAASRLLSEHPDREPSTRELYEAAGVTAPTLYHHFGNKEQLLDAVVEEAFAGYLAGKRGMLRTGELLTDFAAGWDLHIEFGIENPVLYALMYGSRTSRASVTADLELRRALEHLADAGLLRIGVDQAAALTTAMAVGCVTQLNRQAGRPTGPLAQTMRAALISEITGQPPETVSQSQAARTLLAQLGSLPHQFTGAEQALLQQWLQTIATHSDAVQTAGSAAPTAEGPQR
jgi:AcrR family transcriptional regulator